MPQTATREKPIALGCARNGAGEVAALSPAGELGLAVLDRRDVTSLLDDG